MLQFPIIRSIDKLSTYFDFIITAPIPDKFTFRFFASHGFASSQDRDFVVLLKFLGFLEEDGTPTSDYAKLRNKEERVFALRTALSRKYQNIADPAAEAFVSVTSVDYKTAEKFALTLKALQKLTSTDDKKIPEVVSSTKSRSFSLVLPATTNSEVYDKLFAALFKHLKD